MLIVIVSAVNLLLSGEAILRVFRFYFVVVLIYPQENRTGLCLAALLGERLLDGVWRCVRKERPVLCPQDLDFLLPLSCYCKPYTAERLHPQSQCGERTLNTS